MSKVIFKGGNIMAEREFKVYDRQDVIAATTLGADGAPLDGPEIGALHPKGVLP